jgi:hypothetical protein
MNSIPPAARTCPRGTFPVVNVDDGDGVRLLLPGPRPLRSHRPRLQVPLSSHQQGELIFNADVVLSCGCRNFYYSFN